MEQDITTLVTLCLIVKYFQGQDKLRDKRHDKKQIFVVTH